MVMGSSGGKLLLFQAASPSVGIGRIKNRDLPGLYGTDRHGPKPEPYVYSAPARTHFPARSGKCSCGTNLLYLHAAHTEHGTGCCWSLWSVIMHSDCLLTHAACAENTQPGCLRIRSGRSSQPKPAGDCPTSHVHSCTTVFAAVSARSVSIFFHVQRALHRARDEV